MWGRKLEEEEEEEETFVGGGFLFLINCSNIRSSMIDLLSRFQSCWK